MSIFSKFIQTMDTLESPCDMVGEKATEEEFRYECSSALPQASAVGYVKGREVA